MMRRQINTEGQHLMKSNKTYSFLTRLVVLFCTFVAVAWSFWLWWKTSIAPVDPQDPSPISFTVKSGEGIKAIASDLVEEKLIRSSTGFYVLIKLLGIERDLQAGDFRLNRSMDAKTIAYELTHGMSDQWMTLIEGWRNEEMAVKLSKDLDIPENEFLKYAKEGYMFPDTYRIPRDSTAAAVASMFQKNFDTKVTEKFRTDAKKTGLTFDQVITLASIVEREGRSDADRPVIAGILLKRFNADWPLQVDATIQYALGYQSTEKSWWKKELTDEDKKLNSPFNTYTQTGLPPTPICNPGMESIEAVIYPTKTDYWYYLHDQSGTVHFAKTIEEHDANIVKYLQ